MKFLFPELFVTISGLAYLLSSKSVRYGLRDPDFYVEIKEGIFVIVEEIWMDFGVSPLVLPKALKVFLGQISREKKITFPAWHQTLAGFLKFSTFISDM